MRKTSFAGACLLLAGVSGFAASCAEGDSGAGDCGVGRSRCDGACVDLQIDPAHCGACGEPCSEGQVCSSGACRLSCPEGLTVCEGACVDAVHDPENCGRCGHACESGEACRDGVCALCPEALEVCGGLCVDFDTDRDHCGDCDGACDAGDVCVGGACELACPAGLDECHGTCVDFATDRRHCGGCDEACDPGKVCAAKACAVSCPTSLQQCAGSCIDKQNDPKNCGGCGLPCVAWELCANAHCIPLLSSCLEILGVRPVSVDGTYSIDKGDGPFEVYCDMTHGGVTYEALGFGRHDVPHTNWTWIAAADLQDAVIQKAFIWAYNKQGGSLVNLDDSFVSTNCCIKSPDSGTGVLTLGGNYVMPATTSGTDACGGAYPAAAYRFYLPVPADFAPATLPVNYFTTHPAGTGAFCPTGENPGWFFRKTP